MKKSKKRYLVEGDHPILQRVYKIRYNLEECIPMLREMDRLKYENIKLTSKEVFADE